MRVRKMDASGDMVFGHGSTDFLVDSPEAVAQLVLTTLRLLRGEWFMDATAGVSWFPNVVGVRTAGTRDATIRAAILGVQGVTEITAYASVKSGRALSVTATLNTLYGKTEISAVV